MDASSKTEFLFPETDLLIAYPDSLLLINAGNIQKDDEVLQVERQLEEICQSLLILSSKPAVPSRLVQLPRIDSSEDPERQPLVVKISSEPPAPEGGWGWVVVASTFYINFMLSGLWRSYGVLLVAITEEFPQASTAQISWIPGVLGTLSLVLSPLSSSLVNCLGCRLVVFFGGLLTALGTGLCYYLFCIPYLIFAGGVITGIGFTLCVTPCLLILSLYFCRRRALANSLSAAGSALSGLVMPYVIGYFIEVLGLNWTFLLLGGLLLSTCVAACFLKPLETQERPQPALTVEQNVPEIQPFLQKTNTNDSQNVERGNLSKSHLNVTTRKDRWSKIVNSLSLDLLFNLNFVVLALTVILMSAGYPVLYFLPAYAESCGLSKFSAGSLLSYVAVGDLSGRILFGWASDKKYLAPKVEYIGAIIIAAIAVLILPSVKSFVPLAMFAVLYGSATGSWQCLIPVLLANSHGTAKLGGAISLTRVLQGIASLSVPPITGHLYDLHGDYLSSFYMIGTIMAISALAALALPLVEKIGKKRIATYSET